MMENVDLDHHKRSEYCRNRLKYRQGKNLTAVKVYTIFNESSHLLIFGVPKVNLRNELKNKLRKYGPLELLECITDYMAKRPDIELEQFTDVYHVQFKQLHHARRAKKFLDAKTFFGGILHLSYAPEYENPNDVRQKILKRQNEVKFRMQILKRKRTNEDEESSVNEATTSN